MKILHVTNAVGWSGGMAQMGLLIRELARRGHENVLVCQAGCELLPKIADVPVATEILHMHQDYDVIAAYKLDQIIHRMKPDVVHAHHPMAHAIALLAMTFHAQPPLVVSRRVSFSPRKNPFSRWKYRSGHIAKYSVVSQAVRDTLVKGGVQPEKIEVIYSSVDPEKFAPRPASPALRKELGIPEGHQVVGKVANTARWKGQHIFIDAAQRCLARRRNLTFVLAGKDTQSLECVVRERGIQENVRLLGFRKDVPDVLAQFDVSVNSAIEGEGLSGAMRESLMMGIPVVASDVAGNREVVRDGVTGALVPVGDAAALADRILLTLDHLPEARALAQNGRSWVLENATLETMTERFIRLYQSVL